MDKTDYDLFTSRVGKGNVASTLRNFALSYSPKGENTSLNEAYLRQKYKMLKKQKDELDSEFHKVDDQLKKIEAERDAEELKRLEKQTKLKKQWQEIKGQALQDQVRRHMTIS